MSSFFLSKKMVFWLLLFCFTSDVQAEDKPYAHYSVLRVTPQNEKQVDFLHELSKVPDMDFWLGPRGSGEDSHIMVPPFRREEVERVLRGRGISYSVHIENVQDLINKETQEDFEISNKSHKRVRRENNPLWFFKSYHQVLDVYNYIGFLYLMNEDLVSLERIGHTYEKRELQVLKIGSRKNTDKPAIWIDGGIHAREWITVPVAVYIAYQLIQGYKSDETVRKLLDTFDWYIMPIVNPDGYQYTMPLHKNGLDYRLWRKNKFPIPWTGEVGVDLNRNFGYHWGTVDDESLGNPWSSAYQGTDPFSEAESVSIAKFLSNKKKQIKFFLSLHSYSELWLTPYGFTHELPINYRELNDLATRGNQAMKTYNGTTYNIQPAASLYLHSGSSADWAYGELEVPYVYSLEIENVKHQFFTPPEEILGRSEEIWRAVKTMTLYLANN